jgi:hypothetical protein
MLYISVETGLFVRPPAQAIVYINILTVIGNVTRTVLLPIIGANSKADDIGMTEWGNEEQGYKSGFFH